MIISVERKKFQFGWSGTEDGSSVVVTEKLREKLFSVLLPRDGAGWLCGILRQVQVTEARGDWKTELAWEWSDRVAFMTVKGAENGNGKFVRVEVGFCEGKQRKSGICIPGAKLGEGWRSVAAALESFVQSPVSGGTPARTSDSGTQSWRRTEHCEGDEGRTSYLEAVKGSLGGERFGEQSGLDRRVAISIEAGIDQFSEESWRLTLKLVQNWLAAFNNIKGRCFSRWDDGRSVVEVVMHPAQEAEQISVRGNEEEEPGTQQIWRHVPVKETAAGQFVSTRDCCNSNLNLNLDEADKSLESRDGLPTLCETAGGAGQRMDLVSPEDKVMEQGCELGTPLPGLFDTGPRGAGCGLEVDRADDGSDQPESLEDFSRPVGGSDPVTRLSEAAGLVATTGEEELESTTAIADGEGPSVDQQPQLGGDTISNVNLKVKVSPALLKKGWEKEFVHTLHVLGKSDLLNLLEKREWPAVWSLLCRACA